MTWRFLQTYLLKPNSCCIVWSRQQETLVSTWRQRKLYMSFNREGAISTLNGGSLKLVDNFSYLDSNVSSTESDVNIRLAKAWTAIDRLSIISKSDLSDEIKQDFFQAADGCTIWTLIKRFAKKLNRNSTRILRVMLNKYWKQHHARNSHLTLISKTIQLRRKRHAGHGWRSKD